MQKYVSKHLLVHISIHWGHYLPNHKAGTLRFCFLIKYSVGSATIKYDKTASFLAPLGIYMTMLVVIQHIWTVQSQGREKKMEPTECREDRFLCSVQKSYLHITSSCCICLSVSLYKEIFSNEAKNVRSSLVYSLMSQMLFRLRSFKPL